MRVNQQGRIEIFHLIAFMSVFQGARIIAVKQLLFRLLLLWIFLITEAISHLALAADPHVQIISPKDGSRITHEQNLIFLSGRVAKDALRSANIDIFLVVDTSASTAHAAGIELDDPGAPQDSSIDFGASSPSTATGDPRDGEPLDRKIRNSILAAEVAAARRLLAQLNSESTRVGVLTFSRGAKLLQSLTSNVGRVLRVLDDILRTGPHGGTNMVEGIRLGTTELMGLGESERRRDSVKVQLLLTDGYPTLPIGRSREANPEDTNLAIDAARIAGKANIAIHVFTLGEEALSYPQAAIGIAKASGGTYTPVMRPADVLAVVEKISIVGVDYVQVINQTMKQNATQLRLAPDGYFSSAVPVVEGRNQIEVIARASDGSNGGDLVTVYYQPGIQKSLELEIFLEKERKLDLEIKRLGKSPAQIQREVELNRDKTREDSH